MNFKNHPNVFLMGAPKCGTSALSNFLSYHPNVFTPRIPEPRYYTRDIIQRNCLSMKQYMGLYEKANPVEHSVILDDNVFSLYSDFFLNNIADRVRDPKFIVMLRNPISAAISQYLQTFKSFVEKDTESSFSEAWYDLPMRHIGKSLPNNKFRIHYLYNETYLYYKYLVRFFTRFSSQSIKLIFHDDFLVDNKAIVDQTLDWLGLAPCSDILYALVNPTARAKSDTFSNVLISVKNMIEPLWGKVVRPYTGSLGLSKLYLTTDCISTQEVYDSLSVLLKKEMLAHFLPDIENLETLVGKDLSHWKKI